MLAAFTHPTYLLPSPFTLPHTSVILSLIYFQAVKAFHLRPADNRPMHMPIELCHFDFIKYL